MLGPFYRRRVIEARCRAGRAGGRTYRKNGSLTQGRQRRLLLEPLEDRALLAAVITVNTTADADTRDALLSLREAILVSNRTLAVATLTTAEKAQVIGTPTANDRDTIGFNIPGTGVRTISPDVELPPISEPVIIDGYTQPGASANTNGPGLGSNAVIRVELSGEDMGGVVSGLRLFGGNSLITGLAINRFLNGIEVLAGSGQGIEGNLVGPTVAGTVALGN